LGHLANGSVRVANELGAGNGKGARFAIIVSITTSVVIGVVFWCLILYFDDKIALLFTSSKVVLDAVHDLSVLLAFTILLNSVQPVLSGKPFAEPEELIPVSCVHMGNADAASPFCCCRCGRRFKVASVGGLRERRNILLHRSPLGRHTRLAPAFRGWGNNLNTAHIPNTSTPAD
jgi:hypothetical protein